MAPTLSFAQRYGPWALVTGAAMGLGAAFARQCARRGLNLLLVDIQVETLRQLAGQLEKEHGIRAQAIELDLTLPDFWQRLSPQIESYEIGLLVSNAGISQVNDFLDTPLEQHLKTLDLNCRAALVLTHHLGGFMRRRKHGGIITLSSLSAYQGSALVVHYSATKAYNLLLGQGLWAELRPHGVDALAVAVGSTDTPGFRYAGPQFDPKKFYVMQPDETAAEALDALGKQPVWIPGRQNRLSFALLKLLPPRFATEIVSAQMWKMYRKKA